MKREITTNGMTLLGGALAGATLMYLFNPEQGGRRRGALMDGARDAMSRARSHAPDYSEVADHLMARARQVAASVSPDMIRRADLRRRAKQARKALRSMDALDLRGRMAAAAENAASRASDVYHEHADYAADLAHRGLDRVGGLGDRVTDFGRGLYASAGSALHHLADRAMDYTRPGRRAIARRIAPEESNSHAAAYAATGVGTLAAGAAVMYFFDPRNGHRRRARVINPVVNVARETATLVGHAAHYACDTVRGKIHDVRRTADAAYEQVTLEPFPPASDPIDQSTSRSSAVARAAND